MTAYPAGIAPAGVAPIGPYSAPPGDTPPAATFLDLQAKDAVLISGKWKAIHPVDAAVQLSFGVEQGSLAGNPNAGHTLRKVRRGQTEATIQDAKERVRRAQPFARLVSEGAVQHLATRVTFPKYGEVSVVVEYFNLRESASARQRKQVQAV